MNKEEKETIMKDLIIISDWSDKIVDDETRDNVSKLLDIVIKFQIENENQQKQIKYFETKNRVLYEDIFTLLKEGNKTENLNYKYIEEQPIEAQEYKSESYIKDNYISKNKIRTKIEELKEQQEKNRNEFSKAIDCLDLKFIDNISNKICINFSVRSILEELLEE